MPVQTGADKRETYQGDYKRMGKVGEAVVLSWLKRRRDIAEVRDVREIVEYQEADVDFEIEWRSGRKELAEVKTDQYLGVSGNVLFELLRVNHVTRHGKRGEVGWSLRTPADWLFLYAPAKDCLLYVRTGKMQDWFQAWTEQWRQNVPLRWVSTDRNKSTLCALVPWSECGHLFTVVDLLKNTRENITKPIDFY